MTISLFKLSSSTIDVHNMFGQAGLRFLLHDPIVLVQAMQP